MSPRAKRVAILAVGDEITDGQIFNGNANWLATRLVKLGLEVSTHMAVPDDISLITQALDALSRSSSLLILTGGLGPTSDDRTREAVSQWAARPLEFHHKTWEHLEQKLISRGVRILPMQRRQAEFPSGARILKNEVGTADAFYLFDETREIKLWSLPGPPKEIASIWQSEMRAMLETLIPEAERTRLCTWRCMGKGESEFAHLVETTLEGQNFKIGYRLSSPYVEVKVWCAPNLSSAQDQALTRLQEVLKPFVVVRDDEDLAQLFVHRLPQGCEIHDHGTEGWLAQRLTDANLSSQFSLCTHYGHDVDQPMEFVKSALSRAPSLALASRADGVWAAGLYLEAKERTVRTWAAATRESVWTERGRKVVCERVLQFWCEELAK